MRIAISGSHSLGKSTVVNDWVARHPHVNREEEPYRALGLHGPYQILFRDESTRLHNGIQPYREGRYGVMQGESRPHVVELVGSREQRLVQLQQAINEVQPLIDPK